MKKSILTLVFAAAIACFSGNVMAQQPTKPDTAVYKAEISGQQKEAILNVLNGAKTTLLKSANQNTTEQNLNLLQGLQEVMNLLNERFVPVKVGVKALREPQGDLTGKGEVKDKVKPKP